MSFASMGVTGTDRAEDPWGQLRDYSFGQLGRTMGLWEESGFPKPKEVMETTRL